MLAVLAVCVVGPCSAVYVLGPAAAALLPAVGGMVGITLGLGVAPGSFTLPDEITGGWARYTGLWCTRTERRRSTLLLWPPCGVPDQLSPALPTAQPASPPPWWPCTSFCCSS